MMDTELQLVLNQVPPNVDSGIFPVPVTIAPVRLAISSHKDDLIQEIYDLIEATAYNISPLFSRHKEYCGVLAFCATVIIPTNKISQILTPTSPMVADVPINTFGYVNRLNFTHINNHRPVVLTNASMLVAETGLNNRLKIYVEGIPVACDQGVFYNMCIKPHIELISQRYSELVRRGRERRANPQDMIHFTDFDQLRYVDLDTVDWVESGYKQLDVTPVEIREVDISVAAKGLAFHTIAKVGLNDAILDMAGPNNTIEGLTVIHSTQDSYRVFPRTLIYVTRTEHEATLDITSGLFLVDSKIDTTHYMEVPIKWTLTT